MRRLIFIFGLIGFLGGLGGSAQSASPGAKQILVISIVQSKSNVPKLNASIQPDDGLRFDDKFKSDKPTDWKIVAKSASGAEIESSFFNFKESRSFGKAAKASSALKGKARDLRNTSEVVTSAHIIFHFSADIDRVWVEHLGRGVASISAREFDPWPRKQ